MKKETKTCLSLVAAILVSTTLWIEPAYPRSPLQEILDRLTSIEEELEAPSTSATFCISQSRALELGVDWGAELKAEGEVGIGWSEVAKVKLVPAFSIPVVLPPFIPVPTGAAIGLAGDIGRGLDICIELPLTLSPQDQALLEEAVVLCLAEPAGLMRLRSGRLVAVHADFAFAGAHLRSVVPGLHL